MLKIPQLKPREVEKVLIKLGFEFVRQKGSHKIYIKESVGITVPRHNKNLKKGTLHQIIKASGVSATEFISLL